MKVVLGTLSALVLSATLVSAQTGGTSSPSSPGAGAPQGKAGTPGSVGTPGSTPGPGIQPSPSDPATTGRGPGTNPSNPQDQSRRSNPQDLARPGGRNPQDMVAPGVPNIVAPER